MSNLTEDQKRNLLKSLSFGKQFIQSEKAKSGRFSKEGKVELSVREYEQLADLAMKQLANELRG